MKKTLTQIAATALICLAGAAQADTSNLRAGLQASMQRSVDRNSVAGALVHVDLSSGETTAYYPTDTHPMIMELGSLYVLCAEVMDPDGVTEEVDYYMMRDGERFSVVRTEIGNREPLAALAEAGQAVRLD